MARTRSLHVCESCGHQSPKWLGRCPDCGGWNTFVEEAPVVAGPGSGRTRGPVRSAQPIDLDSVAGSAAARISSGVDELDRVLGGGYVPGSVVLLGGEPGIGKSTLLLQSLLSMGHAGRSVLLVSGEESPEQIKLRAARLDGSGGSVRLIGETELEPVAAALEEHGPELCVVDSVQMLWSSEVSSAPGSVSQVREVTGRLLRVAKEKAIALVLVGHVTKSGELAGPRVLEHMVDTVLSFDGERGQPYRVLRAVKNRFGSTNEVGVFEMTGTGLRGIADPSALFLEDVGSDAGSAVVSVLEGTRCLLAEVQALVTTSELVNPRRVSRGVERNRLAMLIAVLSRRAGLRVGDCDVFINVGGGLSLDDPAADLPVAVAVASSWRDRPVPQGTTGLGEVSLTGHLRYVTQVEKRLLELARRGFGRVLLPRRNVEELRKNGYEGPEVVPVTDVREAVEILVG